MSVDVSKLYRFSAYPRYLNLRVDMFPSRRQETVFIYVEFDWKQPIFSASSRSRIERYNGITPRDLRGRAASRACACFRLPSRFEGGLVLALP